MATKRDTIAEIKAIQARLAEYPENAVIASAMNQLGRLVFDGAGTGAKASMEEMRLNYVAVRCVAILQACAKEFVRFMTDENEAAGKPLPKVEQPITLEMVREFKDKALSIGEFVAHNTSFNSFEQINNALIMASDKGIMGIAREWSDKSGFPIYERRLYERISTLFERRNIVCHERNVSVNPPTLGEHYGWLEAVSQIIGSMADYVAIKKGTPSGVLVKYVPKPSEIAEALVNKTTFK